MKNLIINRIETRNYVVSNILNSLSVVFVSLCLILIAPNVQGQETFPTSSFGLRVGGNANSWTNDFPSFEYNGQIIYPDGWKATYGIHIGAYVNIRLSKLVAHEPALLYTTKGTGAILNSGGSTAEAKVVSTYIDIPFLLRLYVSDGFNLFLGPQLAYQLNSNYDISLDNELLVQGEDITDGISEPDFAAVLDLGYEFENGFNINLAGELGLLSVDGYEILDTYNHTIQLSPGYSF
jgi:hypothetical protein